MADRSDLFDAVLHAQEDIVQVLQQRATNCWIGLDLTMAQLKALVVLAQSGPTPIGHLADVLSIGRPSASVLVDALVHEGMVERVEDPEDRRRTLAHLTPRARGLMENLRQGQLQRVQRWLERVSDEDLAALAVGLQALARAAREVEVEVPEEAAALV